jgi:hypothetical protein
MSYTAPTVGDFTTRFPRFVDVNADLLAALLAEALTQVDDSWLEQDYANGVLYLMAHMLVQETGGGADRPGTITSESLGPISISYGTGGVASMSDFGATEYGRRYRSLRNKNFPGVAIASTG